MTVEASTSVIVSLALMFGLWASIWYMLWIRTPERQAPWEKPEDEEG